MKFSGIIVAFAIVTVVFSSIFSLFFKAEFFSFSSFLQDSFILHVINFSLYQAALSTLLSILFAIPLSLGLYKREFFLKSFLLKVFSTTFVLPSLIGVFGILAIYGNSGAINSFLHVKLFNIYGLSGILLAHTFFNIPFATKIFYQALCLIDTNQHKLTSGLGLNAFEKFMHLEFPTIKQEIPQTASLIFMLCFTSFAVVMALGGGPKSTTIEVAIYQAIKYDFDLNQAAFLSILQILICTILAIFVNKFSKFSKNRSFNDENRVFFIDSKGLKIFDYTSILFGILLTLPPLISIIIYGINPKSLSTLSDPQLLSALKNSILIASLSAMISTTMAICIVLTSRFFKMKKSFLKAYILELCGTIILLTPSLVISTGLFIMLNSFVNVFEYAFWIVVFINSLIALPFIIRTLSHNFFTIEQEYQNLCLSLGIKGFHRLMLVEFKALKKPLITAISLSFVLSMGDLSAIALFGTWEFKTLPLLLFEQMGSYKMDEAALSALVLLIFSVVSFAIIEIFLQNKDYDARD